MTRLTTCPPCQIGDHKDHYRVVQAVSEGMMGGAICSCKGECQDNIAERRASFLKRLGIRTLSGSR